MKHLTDSFPFILIWMQMAEKRG